MRTYLINEPIQMVFHFLVTAEIGLNGNNAAVILDTPDPKLLDIIVSTTVNPEAKTTGN